MKTLNELKKVEKIELLQAIATGEVRKDEIKPDTLFEFHSAWWGLYSFICNDEPIPNIIFLGNAKDGAMRLESIVNSKVNSDENT